MFEKLESRYYFRGDLVLMNELHVGSGSGNEKTDALSIMDHNGKPFIPGSSLRGALRSTIERITAAIGLEPCMLIKDKHCVSTNKGIENRFKKLTITEVELFLKDSSNICPVCRLFGSTVTSSKIRITDLNLITGGKCTIRDGVAIDRDTETAKDGAKFDFQTVAKDSTFQFELIGENLTYEDIGLLGIGIQEMINGNFWIGGNTSRGLGKCRLDGLEIKYFDGVDGLKKYLKDKSLSTMEIVDINALTVMLFEGVA